jgi:hypothetical protein
LNEQINLPVWVKTDDSVTFVHIPLASDDDYIQSHDDGQLFWPLSLWDAVQFLAPDEDSPGPGMTSQSLLGYAYLSDPRNPENFLMTNYQWMRVADFIMTATGDPGVLEDTTQLSEGSNPTYDGLTWTLQDGVTQFEPAVIYPRLRFTENNHPEFTEPPDGAVFDMNQEFPLAFEAIATDQDNDIIDIAAEFGGAGYSFMLQERHPGYARYRFFWVPSLDEEGAYPLVLEADDGAGGITEISVTINVAPSVLGVSEVATLPGSQISVPVYLVNEGISSYVGGFILRIQHDTEIIYLQSATRGDRIADWDYFNYTEPDSSIVKIVALADVDGAGHRIGPGSGPVAYLNFWVRPGDEHIGQHAAIDFAPVGDNDNTVTDSTGYWVAHPALENGGILVLDPADIIVGDINVNGIPWEVSDAVLFSNHFMDPEAYPFNPVQRAASDTNRDGVPSSLADLIYLLNVLSGIIPPP